MGNCIQYLGAGAWGLTEAPGLDNALGGPPLDVGAAPGGGGACPDGCCCWMFGGA